MKTEGKLQNRGNGKIINNHQHTGISSRRTWYFVFHPSPVLHLTFSKGKHWDFLGPLCDTYLNMPKNNNDCSEKLVKQGGLVVGDKLGRRRRKVPRQVALGLLSAGLYYVFLAGYASADRISPSDARLQRAGNIAGLEEGRISLERLTRMMSTSVHVELAGSEDTFRELLDHEWDLFSNRPDGTRSTFLVCSAPGRKNAKRLREIAGADSLVETLYYRKREPLCSVASLDQAAASLVASEGDGETFSVEPIPHLAKLASNVATDPSAAALLLSSEALSEDGEGRRGRYLRDRRLREVAEQRAQVLEAAAASTATPTVPTTQRLIDEGVRGFVDGIEIILSLHHERRSKYDTEELARRWLSEAKDQVHLANALRNFHFWGRGQKQQQQGGERGEEEQDVFSSSSEENQRRREIHNHEGRQRAGWAKLLRVIEAGGDKLGRERGDGDADAVEGSGLGSCAFDLARFSVSPNGKKILIHKPHEMVAVAEQRGGGEAGLGEGCISALMGYISVQPEVHYVTARKKSVTMNLAAAWVTQSGVEDYTGLWNDDLQGQDEIIGVADTGVDLNHCHFREDDGDSIVASDYDDPVTDTSKRKVVQYISFVDDFDETGGHGTHVAGTLAGAQSGTSAGDDEADGMAFQGKLAVFDFGDSDSNNALTTPEELGDIMFQPAYDANARVHSNSWDTVSVEYTSISKEVDEFVYTHQDFLVVFAAGNCGDTSMTDDLIDNCDTLDTDSGTVLSPAQAKNVVAVGSSESAGYTEKDINTVSYFSSKGYTNDGRIKPDIVAPGDPTLSSYADTSGETCEFALQTGTSMATPVVAGNAAIARQYFREGWYNSGSKNISAGYDPSAALIKAVLINSATPMELAGVNPETSTLDVTLTDPPDEHQGHGRVTMVNALNVNSTVGIFFKDWVDIVSGETLEYEVSLYEDADTDKDLRITLVWTDPPAAIGSTSALIHDLDLTVVAQSTGTTYYPNGGDEPDEINNVEKITITDTLQNETYTIQVSCGELSEADVQSFALIANGEFIKTNDLPTVPDPDTWLDLVDRATDTLLSWRFGILIGFSVAACCVMICACRRCHRTRRQKLLESRYRQEITRNRSVLNGSKDQLGNQHRRGYRPQPFSGPVRADGGLNATDVGMMYTESWTNPAPGSVGGRSKRSSHTHSGTLTGSGTMIPPEHLSRTTPCTPPQETCPECGLKLPGPVELVAHVETMHGGKATRRKSADKASTGQESKAMELLDGASTVVMSVSKESKTDSDEAPSARASSLSATVRSARTTSAVLNAESALNAAAAAAAATGTRESYPRSNPKRSAISPTRDFVKPRPASPDRFESERHSIRDELSRVSGASEDISSKAASSRLSAVKDEHRQESTRASAEVRDVRDTRNSRGRRSSHQGVSLRLEGLKDELRGEKSLKLMRSRSLDRMSSLSSRAFVRSNGTMESDSSREMAETHGRRRRGSGMNAFPPSPEGCLSSGSMELYGSAYPTFSPVMSPTSRSKEPLYSPVARARAGELDEAQLPISRTRKFFRQLSGEL